MVEFWWISWTWPAYPSGRVDPCFRDSVLLDDVELQNAGIERDDDDDDDVAPLDFSRILEQDQQGRSDSSRVRKKKTK